MRTIPLLFFLILLPGMSILIPGAYAEKIVYTNSYPVWYSYDCTDSSPSTWTKSVPPVNRQKYFSYSDGDSCHAILFTYNLDDLNNLVNTTSINVAIDSQSILLSNRTLSDQYQVGCELYHFGNPTITDGVISQSPTSYESFSCTGTSDTIQEISIPYTAEEITTFDTAITAETYTYSLMIFPDFNATMRTNLSTNNYDYVIARLANELEVNGDGFNCAVIEASNWCNFYAEPWEGVKKALGEDFIGDWFYVFVFLPLPMSVFLLTRNGAYAGFVSLPIILVINTIDTIIFETSLSMLLIASAFGFYEVLRKRLHE